MPIFGRWTNGLLKSRFGKLLVSAERILPRCYWPLESSLNPTAGSTVGATTHAGTNRTYINPDTGLITSIGANLPRFELVGGHRAVLIEPAGTNLIPYSHEFGNWTATRATVSANAITAPDGAITADKLVVDGTAANDHSLYYDVAGASFTDNADVTYSLYVKAGEYTWAFIQIATKTPAWPSIYFNLSTGAVGTESVDAYGTEDMGNGWWRIWLTHDIGAGAGVTRWTIYPAEGNGDITIDGDSSSGIYIWGAQVEESPIPTSYIATSGATATRATESGEPSFALPPGLFDSAGTAICWWRPAYQYAGVVPAGAKGIVSTDVGVTNALLYTYTGRVYSHDNANGTYKALSWAADTWYKIVAKWGYSVGGVLKYRVGVDSGSGVSWSSETTFDGAYAQGANLVLGNGLFSRIHLRQLALFPTVLTDSEINQRGGTP